MTTTTTATPAPGIGAVVRKIRTKLNLTVEDVAQAADVGSATVYRLEQHDVVPSLARLDAIAGALGKTVVQLLSAAEKAERTKTRARK